jgi:hypothetical protein
MPEAGRDKPAWNASVKPLSQHECAKQRTGIYKRMSPSPDSAEDSLLMLHRQTSSSPTSRRNNNGQEQEGSKSDMSPLAPDSLQKLHPSHLSFREDDTRLLTEFMLEADSATCTGAGTTNDMKLQVF